MRDIVETLIVFSIAVAIVIGGAHYSATYIGNDILALFCALLAAIAGASTVCLWLSKSGGL